MATPRKASSRAAAVVSVLLLVAGLSGCGGETVEAGGAPDVPAALTESASELPPEASAPVLPAPETGLPTLPPGDPGHGSAAPEDEDEGHEQDHHDLPPRTDVPLAAMLDVETVGAIAGGVWSSTPVPTETCATPRPASTATTRTAALESSSGLLVQNVSVHPTAEHAEDAVPAAARKLSTCGWSSEEAESIGEAAVQLRRSSSGRLQRVVVVALEGVTVALVATGRGLESEDKVAALVDVAVATSCAAAADGCH